MEPPRPITTSCDALVEAIDKATSSVTRFLKSRREARRELAAYSGQLRQLQDIIRVLHDELEEDGSDDDDVPGPIAAHLRSIISDCFQIIQELDADVLSRTNAEPVGPEEPWAPNNKMRVEICNTRLDALTRTLNMTVDLLTMYGLRARPDYLLSPSIPDPSSSGRGCGLGPAYTD